MSKTGFVMLKLKSEAIERLGLHDSLYPVPTSGLEQVIAGHEELSPAQLLFWHQAYAEQQKDNYRESWPAMRRLIELLCPGRDDGPGVAETADWILRLDRVDLTKAVVAVHRRDDLLAVMQANEDGTLRAACYQPLDAKALRYLMSAGQRPAPDGTVCMRPSNWEYLIDNASTTGQYYAADAGGSHLVFYEFGYGLGSDRKPQEPGFSQRDLPSMRPVELSVQLQVATVLAAVSEEGDG